MGFPLPCHALATLLCHPRAMRFTPRALVVALLVVAFVAASCSVSIDVEAPTDGALPAPTTDPEGVDQQAEARPEASAVWTDASCEFLEPPTVSVSCGWLEVPERWDDPDDGDTVRLHVGIFSAGPADTEPVVYLEGGPGGDALANISQGFDTFFGDIVAAHDVVIIGQRGTGSAEPHLQCDGVLELSRDLLDATDSVDEELGDYGEAYRACAEDFADRGIDTSAYNSIQNAHDVDALRDALGYEQWNVLGVSYGTRLGQTLMRLHPEGIRAIVLDSAVPTERDPSVDQPVTAKRAFETLWDGCAASPSCSGTFPDLENRFFALVDRLDQESIAFEVSDIFTGERYPARLDGDGLIELAFGALYGKAAFSGLPELVEQLERGDTSGVATLGSQNVTSEPFVAGGMYWSVECNEEVPFIDETSQAEGLTGDPRYDRLRPPSYSGFLDTVCGAFDSGVAPAEEDELTTSDLPALVLAGTYDPITPPAGGASLLAGLPNGFFVEYPHTGHGAIAETCAQQMVVAFLAEPSQAPADTCIADIDEPAWVPDLFAELTFDEFTYSEGFFSGSGVIPAGWDEVGPGTWAQSDNLLRGSVILQQVVIESPHGLLIGGFEASLGTEFEELPDQTVAGRTWSRFEAIIPGSVLDVAITDDDGSTHLVVLQHAPADRDAAVAALLEPILEAIGA